MLSKSYVSGCLCTYAVFRHDYGLIKPTWPGGRQVTTDRPRPSPVSSLVLMAGHTRPAPHTLSSESTNPAQSQLFFSSPKNQRQRERLRTPECLKAPPYRCKAVQSRLKEVNQLLFKSFFFLSYGKQKWCMEKSSHSSPEADICGEAGRQGRALPDNRKLSSQCLEWPLNSQG